jgi:serine phosphatase RsbU (regulator of sigma subunit)
VVCVGVTAGFLLREERRLSRLILLPARPRLLQSVNRLFYENTADESYATMFFGVYGDSWRSLRFTNCGHIVPLILRSDGPYDA